MSGRRDLPGGVGQLLSRVLGGGQGGGQGQLVNVVLGMLSRSGGSGGLGGLLSRLRDAGLGEQARSWVETGRNQPVSGKELTEALGEDEMIRLAARAGLTKEETAAALAAALPAVVDAFTPAGEVPAPDVIDAMVDPDAKARPAGPALEPDEVPTDSAPKGPGRPEGANSPGSPGSPGSPKAPTGPKPGPKAPAPEPKGPPSTDAPRKDPNRGPVNPEREA